MGSFTLSAPPNTDLWRKPPSRDTSTAPILYTALYHPFISAEVTVSADWALEWDQAGLVIFAGPPPGRTATSQAAASPDGTPPAYSLPAPPASKWVKAGLEFYGNACHASSVCATSDGADWALASLSGNSSSLSSASQRGDLRVKLERVGHALWVWFEDGTNGWKKLREVTWFFWGVNDKMVKVGVYACRPANFALPTYSAAPGAVAQGQSGLRVEFEGLEIF